jgi:hypothetical protein
MTGFVADPGVVVSGGDLPAIASRLDSLAKRKGITIYAISGYRTPAHSVAVGGFANDPHTQHEAVDIGVNSQLRASAAQLTDADLASVGLTRPFPGAQEINHIQLSSHATNANAIVDGVGKAAGTVKDKVTGATAGLAKDTVSALWSAVGADGARALLYVLLVVAGAALAVIGIARATGLGQDVKWAAKTTGKLAAAAL